jgi:hypothetical protein
MTERKQSIVVAFLVAVILTTVWGSVVQTQYNLAGIASIGAPVSPDLRMRATIADVFSGFSPTYAGYVVAPALLVAFAVASWVASPKQASRRIWFALGGGLAILLAIPLVNYLAPVALLFGATRDATCTVLMALGGSAAGFLFAAMTGRHREPAGREPIGVEPSTAH